MTASARLRALRRPRHALPALAQPGIRWVNIVRACYGIALVGAPGLLISAVAGGPISGRVRAVARVLGARQIVQAEICGLAPTSGLVRAGAAADGLHAASMLALAGTEPGLRRALLAETAIAAAFGSVAVASLSASRGSG